MPPGASPGTAHCGGGLSLDGGAIALVHLARGQASATLVNTPADPEALVVDLALSPAEIRTYYQVRVPNLKLTDAREWRGPCPIHKGKRNSFVVNSSTGFCTCHSECGRGWDMPGFEMALNGADFPTAKKEVLRIVGRQEESSQRIVAEYDYTDARGKLLFQCVRYEPTDFKQRRPDGNGAWCWNLHGGERVLYRLPRLLANPDRTVFVVEGEKDVHTIEKLGMLGTSSPMGAKKWRQSYSEVLRGREVFLLPDNDGDGREDVIQKATSLLRAECTVHIIELPGLREKGDVSDWVAAGGTAEQLEHLFQDSVAEDAESIEELCRRWGIRASSRRAEAIPAGPQPDLEPATDTDGTHHAKAPDDWPEPQRLQGELPPVEDFYPELLPVSLRAWTEDIADRMQVRLDFAGVPAVLCLSGAVGRRLTIQPKAQDGSFVIVPNLWGGIVGRPGLLKTPALAAVLRPLHHIQRVYREEYARELEEYEQEKEEADLRFSAWKDRYKEYAKKGGAAPIRPDNSLRKPALKRLLTNDASFESLHERMAENPAGLLLHRDELAGLLTRLDQEEFANERAFFLTAWNGNEPYTIDRITRGTIHVEACCLAMMGGIQPGRFRTYLADVLADGPSNDGLVQRFSMLAWPDQPSTWRYVDTPPNAAAEQKVTRIFQEIVKLDPETCERFRFAPDAQEMFVAWLSELEGRLRGNTMHPALEAHLSKYRKLMPALALLFELADSAASGTWTERVSLTHAQQAAAGCDYLESHARRIYSCIVTPQFRAAQTLAEKIREKKIGAEGTLSVREVYLKGWSGLDTPETARAAAEILEDAGWLRSLEPASRDPWGRGRPANKYQINPKVWARREEPKV